MSRYRCLSCLGEYDDVGRDGVSYHHVCPPVIVVRARTDTGTTVERPLRGYRGIQLATDDADRTARIAASADPATVYVELARWTAPRRDARDETTLRREGRDGATRVLRAEGKGRVEIAPGEESVRPVADVL